MECDATDCLADPAEPGRVDQRRRDLGFGIGVEPPDTDRFLGDVERPAAIVGNAMLGFGGEVELPCLARIDLAVGARKDELLVDPAALTYRDGVKIAVLCAAPQDRKSTRLNSSH